MIKSADLIIAESSYVSTDIGQDILYAIREKKPVIAMYNLSEDLENPRHIRNIPIGLQGNRDKYLLLREYRLNSVASTLPRAIKDAEELLGTKFNLILPPELDKFLHWASKKTGLPKSEITRQAIEHEMKRFPDFKNY
jgi:hypothetical protein